MALYLTPNDIRIGRCSLPHDWFVGFQVVWGLISVVAWVRSGAVAKSAIVGVPSFGDASHFRPEIPNILRKEVCLSWQNIYTRTRTFRMVRLLC